MKLVVASNNPGKLRCWVRQKQPNHNVHNEKQQ